MMSGKVAGVAVEQAIQYLTLDELARLIVAEEDARIAPQTVACSETTECGNDAPTARPEAA